MTFELAKAMAASEAEGASEDRAEVFDHDDAHILVIADGAGGRPGGAFASSSFVAAVERALEAMRDVTDLRAWVEVFAHADQAILGLGETTAVVVVVSPHVLFGLSVGDSEAWLVSSTGIERLTKGQNTFRIGSGRAQPVGFHRRRLEGTLVVATDGLFKYADRTAIARCCSLPVADAANALLALPRLLSGDCPDDLAVIVAR